MINTSNIDGSIAFANSGRYDALPTRRVIWGDGCRNQLPAELSKHGASRVLLLTTESLARQAEYVQQVVDLLAERHIATISSLPAHVPAHALDTAWSSIAEARPDLIVAFGGGSVIDAAKAIAVRLREQVNHAPDIIALPTTLSGAEYAHVYGVLEDGDHGLYKRTYVDPDVTPRIVFLDPTLNTGYTRQAMAQFRHQGSRSRDRGLSSAGRTSDYRHPRACRHPAPGQRTTRSEAARHLRQVGGANSIMDVLLRSRD